MDLDRFDKFTEQARKVLSYAQEEAQKFSHNYIGTEHLLLGLLRNPENVATKVLLARGIALEKIRHEIEFIIGRGDRIVLGAIGLTPRAKKVIELAVDEARRMNHRYIGTEHLLLALMREGEGIAGGVLKSQGLSLEDLRTTTIQLVGSSSTLHAREETIRQQIFSSGVTFTIFPQDIPYGQLSPLSISALTFAGGELARLKQLLLTPELLLLGLLHEGSSPAAQALQKQGVTIDKARSIIEQKEPEQEPDSTHPGISVLLSAYLLIAHKEAQTRDEELISPEHLLLAMLRDEQGPLENILTALGTTRTKVRETLIPLL